MKNLTTKITLLRHQKGYSQEEMAEHLNMSTSAYSRIENSKNKKIDIDVLEKIANVHNIPITDEHIVILKVSDKQTGGNGVVINSGKSDGSHFETRLRNLEDKVELLLKLVK